MTQTAGLTLNQRVDQMYYFKTRGLKTQSDLMYLREQMSFVEKLARSAQYGSADFASALLRRIGTFIPGEDIFDENGDWLEQWKRDNPHYAPEEVDSAWELLTNPSALSQQVAASLPYILSTATLAGIGTLVGGPVGASAAILGPLFIGYAVEGQNAYDDAIRNGASPEQAEMAANITGAISGLIETTQVGGRVFKLAGLGKKALTDQAVSRAMKLGRKELIQAGKLIEKKGSAWAMDLTSELAKQGLEESLQGAVADATALHVYGKPVKDGFFDRRAQEFIGGAAAGTIFAGMGRGTHAIFGGNEQAKATYLEREVGASVPIYNRDELRKLATKDFGYTDEEADAIIKMTDAHAKVWAQNHDSTPEEFYKTRFAFNQKVMDGETDEMFFQSADEVRGYASKVMSVMPQITKEFATAKKLDVEQVLGRMKSLGVSDKEMEGSGFLERLSMLDEFNLQTVVEAASEYPIPLSDNAEATQQMLDYQDEYRAVSRRHNEVVQQMLVLMQKQGNKIALSEDEKLTLHNLTQEMHALGVKQSDLADRVYNPETSTKWHEYTFDRFEESGSNKQDYFELLFKAPNFKAALEKAAKEESVLNFKAAREQNPNADSNQFLRIAQSFPRPASEAHAALFKHFGSGPLFHMRLSQRRSKSGEMILHIEEIQSDLDNKLRKMKAGRDVKKYSPEDMAQVEKLLPFYFDKYKKIALRKAMQFAAEGGYDGVAISSGNQTFTANAGQLDITPAGKTEAEYLEMQESKRFVYDTLLPREVKAIFKQMGIKHEIEEVEYGGITDERLRKSPLIRLTPELKQKALGPIPLYQNGKKASVTFLADGAAVIRALQNPDKSSLLHELGHVFRRSLTEEDLSLASQWAGAENGSWTREAEEKFAKGFEKYLRDGQAPAQELVSVFKQFKDWLREVYRTLRGSVLKNVKLDDNIKGVFDRLFVMDDADIASMRQDIIDLKNDLKLAETNDEKQILKNRIKTAEEYLKDALEGRRITPTRTDEATKESRVLSNLLPDETKERSSLRIDLRSSQDRFLKIFSMAAPLQRTAAGRKVVEILDDVHSEMKSIRGELEPVLVEAFNNLTMSDHNWMAKTTKAGNHGGFTNLQRVVERSGIPEELYLEAPNERIKRISDLFYQVNQMLGTKAQEAKILRKMKNGQILPFKNSALSKFPRVPTDDFWLAITQRSGKFYDTLLSAIQELNPDLTIKDITADLQRAYGNRSERKVGLLEETRKIDKMPGVIYLPGSSKAIPVFRTEPYHLITKSIELQALKIGMAERFGQHELLKGVNARRSKNVKTFLKSIGVDVAFNEQTLKDRLLEAGENPEDIIKMDFNQLKKYAKSVGIPATKTYNDHVEAFEKIRIPNLTELGIKRLRKFADRLGGIDSTKTDLFELHRDIMERLTDPNVDILGELARKHAQEAGHARAELDFKDFIRVFQGLPFHWMDRSLGNRFLKLTSDIIGAAQTSLSVIPNIPQTAMQVPKLAGMGNYLQAVKNTLAHRNLTQTQIMAMGGFQKGVLHWGMEHGYKLESVGRNIRQGTALITGAKFIGEMNNTIAGESFRLLGEQWLNSGLSVKDIPLAKQLRLNDSQIKMLREGSFESDYVRDQILKKIIQNGISVTQFTTENRARRGLIENIPLLNMLFAYSNYTIGTTRANVTTVGALMSSLKELRKSPGNVEAYQGVLTNLQSITALMVGSVGAGFMANIMREAISGRAAELPENEEAWEILGDKALAGLVEVQLLGAAQRMLDPLNYSNGIPERALIGLMPQVAAIVSLFGTVAGMGKASGLELDERILGKEGQTGALTRNAPVIRNLNRWMDLFAYPDQIEQEQVRRMSREFVKETRGGVDFYSNLPSNPAYDALKFYAKRYDYGGLSNAFREYYVNALRTSTSMDELYAKLRNARGSLISSGPVSMGPELRMAYFLSLSPGNRRKAIVEHFKYSSMVNSIVPKLGHTR